MKTVNNSITASYLLKNKRVFRPGLLIILPLLLGVSFMTSSSARRSEKAVGFKSASGALTGLSSNSGVGQVKAFSGDVQQLSISLSGLSPLPFAFMPESGPETIDTFETTCTTQQSHFTVGDTVCAHAGGTLFGSRSIYWVNPDRSVVQIDAVDTNNRNSSRLVSQVGNWTVYLIDSSDGSARAIAGFTVSDPQQPSVDLSVVKTSKGAQVTSGNPITYEIVATNHGPDTASAVALTDAVPSGLTYISSSQDAGPTFTRTQDTPVTTWTIASLAPGASATFTFTYQVTAVAGTTVANTASITNAAVELHPEDNTWTATDTVVTGGGGTSCSLDCPNSIIVTATTHGAGGGAVVDYSTPEAVGTCGTVNMSQASHTFFPTGTTTVQATSTDGGGFCSFTVTVIDSDPPTISCPADITASTITGSGDAAAFVPGPNGPSDPGTPTATGNHVTVTGGRSDGQALTAAYPIGATQITWTATECNDFPQCTNGFARSASCVQTITVTSADIPTITCPSDKSFDAGGDCQKMLSAADIGTPTTGGLNPTVVASRADGLALSDPFPGGVTIITWTASNNLGSASCTQRITITTSGDTTPPTFTFVPPDVNVTTTTCSALVEDELGSATATDNCSAVTITRTGVPRVPCPIPGDLTRTCESFIFPVGTTDVTYTAKDAAGNAATAVQHVTVHETTPPIFTTFPSNVGPVNNDPGLCGAVVSDVTLGPLPTVSDICDTTVIRSGVPAGNLFPVGDTIVTYTAKADITVTVTQHVTVVDNTPPKITCPADVLNVPTEPGICAAHVNPGTATATDNCDSNPTITAVRSDNQPLTATYPRGTTTITWTATDASGNHSSCDQTITVVDKEPPVIVLNGQTPSMWPPNHKYHAFGVTDFVTSVTDNCDTISVSSVAIAKVTSDEIENGNGDGNTLNDIVIAADCKSVQLRSEREGGGNGRVYTIYFSVSDTSGNVGTATAKVVVQHNPGETAVDSGVHYTVCCHGGTCP